MTRRRAQQLCYIGKTMFLLQDEFDLSSRKCQLSTELTSRPPFLRATRPSAIDEAQDLVDEEVVDWISAHTQS